MSIAKFDALKHCANNGIFGYNKGVPAYLDPKWCGNFGKKLLIDREHVCSIYIHFVELCYGKLHFIIKFF